MSLAPDIVAGVARRLAEHAGLELPAWVVEARTAARIAELEMDPASYVELIASGRGATELAALVEAVRVGESSLFRHRPQIAALVDVVIPALRAKSKRAVKVWSAGCATGEEPYTLATVLAHAMPGVQISVVATDVSAEALDRARDATFAAEAFDDVPEEWHDSFIVDGDCLRVHPDIAQLVTFERANLLDAAPPRGCDLVWCRNVLIYFSTDARRRVIERLIASLSPGGFLFVGYSETLRDIANLETHRHGDTVFYGKPEKETTAPGVESYRTPPYGTQVAPARRTPMGVREERETTNIGLPPPPPTTRSSQKTSPGVPIAAARPSPGGPIGAVKSSGKSSPGIALPPLGAPSTNPSSASSSGASVSDASSSGPSSSSGASSSSSIPVASASKSSPSLPVSSAGKSSPSIPISSAGKSSPSIPISSSAARTAPDAPPSRTIHISLAGQPLAQDVTALLGDRLATRGIERLVVDLDPAEMLSDDLVSVFRRARAAAMTSGVSIELVATKPGTRRWLSRHGLEDA